MGLNLKKLNELQTDLSSRGGKDGFLTQKDLKAETDIRILPPKANLNGDYFVKTIIWWIDKKKYVSPATFGKECPIEEEFQEAREAVKADPEANAELAELLDDEQQLKKKEEFLIPILHLDAEWDNKNVLSGLDVIGGKAKVFQIGPMLMKEINAVVTSRVVQNESEDGITDRKLGSGILITKTGSGLTTEYKAVAWRQPNAMPKEFYADDKIPDILAMVEKEIDTEAKLRGAIRKYLYGEEAPAEAVTPAKKPAAPVKAAAKPVAKSAAKAVKPPVVDDNEEEEEVVVPPKKGTKAAVATTGKRNLLDSLEDD